MSFITLFLVILILPSITLSKPTIKLTFNPDANYYKSGGDPLEIRCELHDRKNEYERAQLWYIDPKTNRRLSVTRDILKNPTSDLPEIFTQTPKRYNYQSMNHIRIQNLQMLDSAKYECDCPECEDLVIKQTKDLYVMKLNKPYWHINHTNPIPENTKTIIRCIVDDFYPYVSHQVFRNHHDITKDGKTTPPNATFPQKFVWEAEIKPTGEWHNTELRCEVTEGSVKEESPKEKIQVQYAPRFGKCAEAQHVDSTQEQATIECSFSGYPTPELTWFRVSDQKVLSADLGVKVDVVDEHHGKWKSIVRFDREKLIAMPMTTPPTTTNAQGESGPAYPPSDNYYQQLLNDGFLVKIKVQGVEKLSRAIRVVSDAKEARSSTTDSSTIIHISTCLILFAGLTSLIVRH